MKKNTTTRSASTYESVTNNVYFDGTSYRTRVCVNGTVKSKSFASKRKAIEYRNQLLSN